MSEITRFAPSPTGFLHLGHAYAAIRAQELATDGGRFLLRIEDLDSERCRPEYAAAIKEDLGWLGLSWEQPMLAQSSRSQAYRDALEQLNGLGLLYPCFCTRREIALEISRATQAPHESEVKQGTMIYPGTCRALPAAQRRQRIAEGKPYVLRLNAQEASVHCAHLKFSERGAGPNQESGEIRVQPLLFGDVVLARKDLPAAYHLAVVVDDAYQGVTLVTRGHDLFAATHVQRVLQSLLGLPEPFYSHHTLILDEHGTKFSKRTQAITLRSLRADGMNPTQIRERLQRYISAADRAPPLA